METDTKQNGKRRVIIVKKKAAKAAKAAKVGMEMYDEYIEKSGLEPKTYQREGVAFCIHREEAAHRIRGGIIADEMGLGKTIMMMGLILANFQRTLIVVPVALIAQWVTQLKKTIIDTGVKSDLSILVFHGSTGKRSVVLSEAGGSMVWCHRHPNRRGAIDIVITTYGCVGMEEPATSTPKKIPKIPTLSLLTFRPDRVIFDEAHHLRNKSSRLFKGAMRVVAGSAGAVTVRPSVWIVTGTPIQNKIADLKSLCYILGLGVDDLMTDEKRRTIRDEYVLRRTKVSVGMVGKAGETGETGEDIVVHCAPRLQSLKHYKSQVPWTSETELNLSREIHKKARNTTDRAERLKLYTRMHQMCVWPSLISGSGDITKKVLNADSGSDLMNEIETHGLSKNDFSIAISSQSKLDRVVATIIEETAAAAAAAVAAAAAEVKSVVFCHYRREMLQLQDMLIRNGIGSGSGSGSGSGWGDQDIAIIDGTVSARERARIFDAAPPVLILQIRTCSEGLNLQKYSNVYFVSPHWNPCVEDQAIARCYRMGQTKGVRVFRFYMTDFVAERIENDTNPFISGEECISTLDHKCEEIQEKKRVLCNEFLCRV
jgi:SNF2 family DNA or RNA helicase